MYPNLDKAHSFSTGIIFYSKYNKESVTLATIDESQNIRTKQLSEKEANKEIREINAHFEGKAEKLVINIAAYIIIFLVVFTIGYLFNLYDCFKFLRILDGKIIWFFLASSSIVMFAAAIISTFFSTTTRKFHAAEHMIVHAYRKLHKIPSIEEIRRYSRFDTNCGTNSALAILIPSVVFLTKLFFNLDTLFCFKIILALDFSLLLGIFNFVQALVTKAPTDRELNVAIEGLRVWLENEQKLENKENNFS